MSAATDAQALINKYFDAFNAADSAAMLACLADNVRHDVNQGGIREGKAAFEAFNAHMARCYREQLSDIVVMVSEDGRRAAAEFIVDGAYLANDEGLPPANGQTYRLPAGTFFTLENGRIARVTTYYNLQEWVRQVGGEG
ncbi:MAG: nuclear transport factor 2 family protein [Rhodobacteraceae bacterium]|nr:nuclear transport factor 2 family protein [Paracoccaceae bacterium]